MALDINQVMVKLQAELKAPKSQYNKFGKYSYRNCEDILEALKPLMHQLEAYLILQDEVIEVGGWFFIKATATLHCNGQTASASAYARHSDDRKGMDDSQVTGSASSYARKYALNGLFCIDDQKDADTPNQHEMKPKLPTLPNAPGASVAPAPKGPGMPVPGAQQVPSTPGISR